MQKLADTISGYFVPAVLVLAAITFVAWLVFGASLTFALTALIAVLVIACPCALGLASPTAIMVGTGKAAENGILVRGGEALEQARKIDTIVLDKTGTLTPRQAGGDGHRPGQRAAGRGTAAARGGDRSRLGAPARRGDRGPRQGAGARPAKAEEFSSVTGKGSAGRVDGRRSCSATAP
jgi:Cu+-exporting ATPase